MLQKTKKCEYHGDGVLADLYPFSSPLSCPYCHGSLEYETTVHLLDYDGEFREAIIWQENEGDPTDIDDYTDDMMAWFKCSKCGDGVSLMADSAPVACKCGRVYRLISRIEVDESHVGDQEYLIEASK